MPNEPAVAIGHVALSVGDVAASRRFYAGLGLEARYADERMAILELRGGTHLLLFGRAAGPAVPPPERVDLMIAGRSRDSLEAYRAGLIARGIAAPAIAEETQYGHHLLHLRDPDGHAVVVATSHCAEPDG